MESAVGRADVVVYLTDAVYVFAFKIGVNFDSQSRCIGDWKVVEG